MCQTVDFYKENEMNAMPHYFRIKYCEDDIVTLPVTGTVAAIEKDGIEFHFKEIEKEEYTVYSLTVTNRKKRRYLPKVWSFCPE